VIAAMREALLLLGYNHTYHTYDAVRDMTDCKLWLDLIAQKTAGQEIERWQFDQILGHSQVSGQGAWNRCVENPDCVSANKDRPSQTCRARFSPRNWYEHTRKQKSS
jgi:hypothetical protein